jgi:hypothetical protein
LRDPFTRRSALRRRDPAGDNYGLGHFHADPSGGGIRNGASYRSCPCRALKIVSAFTRLVISTRVGAARQASRSDNASAMMTIYDPDAADLFPADKSKTDWLTFYRMT